MRWAERRRRLLYAALAGVALAGPALVAGTGCELDAAVQRLGLASDASEAQPAVPDEPDEPDEPAPGEGARIQSPAVAATSTPAPVSFVGVIVDAARVELIAPTTGNLVEVTVHEGQAVTEGAVLARIDDPEARAERAVARAERRAAKARVGRAAIEVSRAERERSEQRRLAEAGLAAAHAVDEAQTVAAQAVADHRQAKADLAAAQARVDRLEARLARTELVAPFDGTVTTRRLDPGARVTAEMPILTLSREADPWVRFAVSPAQAAELRGGAVIDVDVGGATRRATIERIAPRVDAAAEMIFVSARLEPAPVGAGSIAAGQPARVRTRGESSSRRPASATAQR